MYIIKAIKYRFFFMLSLELLLLCVHGQTANLTEKITEEVPILTGAQQSALYYPLIKGKRMGIVTHKCSRIGDLSLIKVLLAKGMNIRRIFSPEHDFTGTLPDGVPIVHGEEPRTGIPIISLYRKYKKPLLEQMKNIDLMIFDLQDVGARFYTYLTTLDYIMEACAKENTPLVLLDRLNPNGYYIDGPLLKTSFRSFVGRHPIPIVYGMTIREYAPMILGKN